jgi:glycosyltransferase involved in cell wall biosynthesis
MYPRFSETFVVNEILAREAAGADVDIFSLRPPVDPRFHATLADVRAPVTWIRHGGRKVADLWPLLAEGERRLGGFAEALPDLLAVDADDGVQAVELALAVQERGVTHLHAHFASVATTVARLASRCARVPYSFTAHAKDIFHVDVDRDDMARKLAGAHHVVTVSDFNADHLRVTCGEAVTARLHRVYNGIDLDTFPFAAPHERAPIVVAVGRLVEKKGFEVLLDACAVLARTGRPFACDVVGGGPLEGDLRAQASRLGLDEIVRFHGPLPQGEVRDLVAKGAALAAPCVVGEDGNRDGLPTVLLEAMAVGTPCVATPVTGIPEVVRQGDTGLLVPERDPSALAAALARLLDDDGLRVRLATRARALVEEAFDIRHQAARLAALLADPEAARAMPGPRARAMASSS